MLVAFRDAALGEGSFLYPPRYWDLNSSAVKSANLVTPKYEDYLLFIMYYALPNNI